MANGARQAIRTLYKEIVPGDLRRIYAESNDVNTGGRACDFRFGSYLSMISVAEKMFPNQVIETRRRRGAMVPTTIYLGYFYWNGVAGNIRREVSYFKPPTDVRPAEGRIARVHEQPCLSTTLVPTPVPRNKISLFLIQLSDFTVWLYYAEEQASRTTGLWDPQVA